MSWPETETAFAEKRRELVLSGAEIASRVAKNGIDINIFKLLSLNFLEVSHCGLTVLPEDVGDLGSLTRLVLRNNKLEQLPSTIGKLVKLKMLDVSCNCLESMPDELTSLQDLQSLNLSANNLSDIPDISSLVQLHVLNLSQNKLEALPAGITNKNLSLLAELNADGNNISELPTDLYELPSLKVLNVCDNQLTELPYELSKCLRLKELTVSGNKLKDRRLQKMVQQCHTKSILDYLFKNVSKKQQKEKEVEAKEKKKAKEISKKERKKERKAAQQDVDSLALDVMKILHFDASDGFTIKVTENIADVRPYIVCCIVKDIDFGKSANLFKRFITLQVIY